MFSHSLDALQLAKKHIEEEYSVVGIVEEFANTMLLLEHYIPGTQLYFMIKVCCLLLNLIHREFGQKRIEISVLDSSLARMS